MGYSLCLRISWLISDTSGYKFQNKSVNKIPIGLNLKKSYIFFWVTVAHYSVHGYHLVKLLFYRAFIFSCQYIFEEFNVILLLLRFYSLRNLEIQSLNPSFLAPVQLFILYFFFWTLFLYYMNTVCLVINLIGKFKTKNLLW